MSDPDPGHNRLAALAADIRAAHADIQSSFRTAADRALTAGRLLLEAKSTVKHGMWGQWLKTNTGLSERTARLYMQLARSGLETATVADLGLQSAARSVSRASSAVLKKERSGARDFAEQSAVAFGVPFDETTKTADLLSKVHSAVMWAIGDWQDYGIRNYGEQVARQTIQELTAQVRAEGRRA